MHKNWQSSRYQRLAVENPSAELAFSLINKRIGRGRRGERSRWTFTAIEDKSVHVNYTNKRLNNPPNLIINKKVVPYENKAKYLGMTFDTKLK